eukprot:TRINITY_DN27043_c0_g1_i1.p1 TRINITY_DN27043_c0_g1~~TRINITY_DN27043_c0_g1_i1.p1  ORF type:complete len:234 (+),score=59.90 TRINITY_DN27043_c0_g1_i1:105-806(+)
MGNSACRTPSISAACGTTEGLGCVISGHSSCNETIGEMEDCMPLSPLSRQAAQAPIWVAIEKEDESQDIGLDLDSADRDVVQVCHVKRGPVQSYNAMATKDQDLRVGDLILEVNGLRHSTQMMQKMNRGSSLLGMLVVRPALFVVCIDKNCGPLGIDIDFTEPGCCFLVRNVKSEGLIHEWNAANQGYQVKSGDRIMKVNGREGSPKELLRYYEEATNLVELTVARKPPRIKR